MTSLLPHQEKQSIFVHELNSKALCWGRKLCYMCTFSTHYKVAYGWFIPNDRETPKMNFKEALFNSLSWVDRHTVEIMLDVFKTAGEELQIFRVSLTAVVSRSCEMQQNQSASRNFLSGRSWKSLRSSSRYTEHQTTSVPAISWIQAFPWNPWPPLCFPRITTSI